ncbi:alpha/beta hydrolase [Brasilonema octagenarum UFV-E1]|uniref:Alpha/beta hydrolase n=2 Tax=Brasilonema TaxID=383614 RepID=A0A856MQS0_9CYAN|nr:MULTISPECIES: alpha/beta hydrolase [Brasilonema]NMF63776.1 alpha/beta hydrolase [Brasilonema octagenarum UFV-OR1]QDL11406.1 alpha/beta hydrolase [Brasilonema sennae CENA114]QDL17748.1 alpha/beta hydrolase [Brasilonema octagenarum UFV-E1]QDL17797.1 alpha/beta hydrolase [Brasilonema octagenarum UFV-E1]
MNKPIKRAFLDTEDGQILYRIGGEGSPLLLLHQQPMSSNEYRDLMPILAKNRCVIAMDLLGYGDSDKPPKMYSIEDYAKTVILLLDKLGIKTTTILGHLTGAFVAGEVAAEYPERVEKLVLSDPIVLGEEGKAALLQQFSEGFQIKTDGSHLMERWAARAKFVESNELNHRLVLDDLKGFGYPFYAVWAVANYCLKTQERFTQIKCPSLILWGTEGIKQLEQLGLANADNHHLILTAIPHAKVIEIEGGTTYMMLQRFEEISKVVIEFLEEKSF